MIKKIMKVMKIKMRKIILMKIRMEIYQFKLKKANKKQNKKNNLIFHNHNLFIGKNPSIELIHINQNKNEEGIL